MDNHVHLLLETREANLGVGMGRLHGSYAQHFNSRHGTSGHLFQGRYGSARITTDERLWTLAVYIAMNPVVAGLCRRPDDGRGAVTQWSCPRPPRTGSTFRTSSSTSPPQAATAAEDTPNSS